MDLDYLVNIMRTCGTRFISISMKGKLMKYLLALALVVLCTVPAEATDETVELMPFDFTSQCLPLRDMAEYLGSTYGQVPFMQGNNSWIEVDERPIAGGLLIAVNPVSGTWSQVFIAPGEIACILSYGVNLQVNGAYTKPNGNSNRKP
jgi:hypothetical protein